MLHAVLLLLGLDTLPIQILQVRDESNSRARRVAMSGVNIACYCNDFFS